MEMKPVTSSNIEAVGHDPATNKMQARFKGGAVYEYDDVPADKHAAMVGASSIGGHFHAHIKGSHTFRKL